MVQAKGKQPADLAKHLKSLFETYGRVILVFLSVQCLYEYMGLYSHITHGYLVHHNFVLANEEHISKALTCLALTASGLNKDEHI